MGWDSFAVRTSLGWPVYVFARAFSDAPHQFTLNHIWGSALSACTRRVIENERPISATIAITVRIQNRHHHRHRHHRHRRRGRRHPDWARERARVPSADKFAPNKIPRPACVCALFCWRVGVGVLLVEVCHTCRNRSDDALHSPRTAANRYSHVDVSGECIRMCRADCMSRVGFILFLGKT